MHSCKLPPTLLIQLARDVHVIQSGPIKNHFWDFYMEMAEKCICSKVILTFGSPSGLLLLLQPFWTDDSFSPSNVRLRCPKVGTLLILLAISTWFFPSSPVKSPGLEYNVIRLPTTTVGSYRPWAHSSYSWKILLPGLMAFFLTPYINYS